jgi:hypothetical protein
MQRMSAIRDFKTAVRMQVLNEAAIHPAVTFRTAGAEDDTETFLAISRESGRRPRRPEVSLRPSGSSVHRHGLPWLETVGSDFAGPEVTGPQSAGFGYMRFTEELRVS